ncbi:DUF6323 family protein [Bariatricus massiliensis]|uniref:DUF6323 family protein n=1 Tax=Bariatricus massiliensis TaxID=1745713 RepID=A0ABS8DE08_9FIRM|nr:DUF6323 family protein [Bariatricus massiliensis]MCB7303247.1 DUF6323 family protein [Bariatricus massiliensis]MCB7373379.1 DUF6323 family protein [Bariatricus massiliensis]MCB7386049.1 DUF6323 family protein [Bariatricus massiliensis]MCB7410211.1 DUF6323 family protein [Bariatricus massiliensis]MCQ5252505.1 DUF6323 family protein [Bariatricus massiliensis]
MDSELYGFLEKEREKTELAVIADYNDKTRERFALSLSEEEAKQLIVSRNASLKKYHRVEFGRGILDKLIYTFCDSQYICQNNYSETLIKLQDIFYEYKNEVQDKVTDDELLMFMKEQFEGVCYGDVEYLEGTCLKRFAQNVRMGYRGYEKSGGKAEYETLSEEKRWDDELYYSVLEELFW